MPYDFDDLDHQDHLAPSEIRPPMNFADGGLVSNPLTNVLGTQSQMNLMSRPTGSFSGMSSQLNTNPSPAVMAQKQNYQGLPQYQPRSYQPSGMPTSPPPTPATQSVQRTNPYDQGLQLSQKQPEDFPAQPFEIPGMGQAPMVNQQPQQPQPQVVQVEQQPQSPLAMAKGGSVAGKGPERLIAQIRKKFAEQGIDFDKIMAMRLQHMGQKGDTMLAHINPEEAKMLKDNGGSGKINPHTGLVSFSGAEDGGGSQTSSNYGGPSGGSDAGREARGGDTPGFGSGGGGSVGGGGGYGAGSGGSPAGGGDRGGRDNSDAQREAAVRRAAQDRAAAELNAQRAAQEAAARAAADNAARVAAERAAYDQQQAQIAAQQAAAANAARIAAEKAAYEQQAQQSILSRVGNAFNQVVGITPAEAGTASAAARAKQAETDAALRAISEAKLAGVTGSVPLGFKSPQTIAKEANLAENQAQAAIDAAGMRAGFPTGQPNLYTPTTGPTTTFNAGSSGIVPTGSFVKEEKTIPELIKEFINPENKNLRFEQKYTLPDVGLRIGSQGTAAITTQEKSPFQTIAETVAAESLPKSPLASMNAQPSMSNAVSMGPSPAQFRAAENKSMADLVAAQAAAAAAPSVFDEYNANPPAANVPFPTPVPGRVPVQTEEPAPVINTPIPPEDIPPAPPLLTRTGVPMPPIPYRDLGEGNILDSLLKPFGLDTESWINNKAAEYEAQGLTPSDAAIRASYDLRDLQLSQRDRAENRRGSDSNVPPLSKRKKPLPEDETEGGTEGGTENETKPKEPYRSFYMPNIDYSTYGLTGGEASYYKAKGGAVSPLKAVKKHG